MYFLSITLENTYKAKGISVIGWESVGTGFHFHTRWEKSSILVYFHLMFPNQEIG